MRQSAKARDLAARGLGAALSGCSLRDWRGKPASGIWKEVVCGQYPWRMGDARQGRASCRNVFKPLLTLSSCQAIRTCGYERRLMGAALTVPAPPPACLQDWNWRAWASSPPTSRYQPMPFGLYFIVRRALSKSVSFKLLNNPTK